MKHIKIRNCGICPFNTIHQTSKKNDPLAWVDFCFLSGKIVNPNVIDENCLLEDFNADI